MAPSPRRQLLTGGGSAAPTMRQDLTSALPPCRRGCSHLPKVTELGAAGFRSRLALLPLQSLHGWGPTRGPLWWGRGGNLIQRGLSPEEVFREGAKNEETTHFPKGSFLGDSGHGAPEQARRWRSNWEQMLPDEGSPPETREPQKPSIHTMFGRSRN